MHWYLKIKSKNLDNEVIQKLTCRIISNFISDDAKQQIKLQKKKMISKINTNYKLILKTFIGHLVILKSIHT